uniref:Thrombopoietin n=1 Tax=Kryptolebias marmoratus TaxID=37003 RepID=A0A3Q3AIE9_KRYMA
MWDAETNPEVFVCSRVARKALNVVPQIQTALVRILSFLLSFEVNFVSQHQPWMLNLIFIFCFFPFERTRLLRSPQGECFGSANLSAPVQLPCTELHVATWENKSVRERKADVVASLGLLRGGVKMLRITAQAECGTSLLQRLENNIENYLLILTHLQLSVRSRHSDKPLSAVLRSYSRLILGKLERFVVKLEDRCASR